MIASLIWQPAQAQLRRGAFALHYGEPMSDEQIRWYGCFDTLVTHECLPLAQVDALHASGTKLFFYEWSVAFYETRADDWQRSLLAEGSPRALLNTTPLRGGAGAADGDAYYYDPADAGGVRARIDDLTDRLHACRYDGIFFDTTRFENVHHDARAEFLRRHPKLDYNREFAELLHGLRRRGALIFTNQGFRDGEHFLRWADWDLSESYVTFPHNGAFVSRPWNDASDAWNSTRFIFEHMIVPEMRRHPSVRFAHLNYVDRRDVEAIHRTIATALLFDGVGYVAGPSLEAEVDDSYFLDFGAPLGPRVDRGDVSYREFECGLAIINGGTRPFALPDPRRYGTREVGPGAHLLRRVQDR